MLTPEQIKKIEMMVSQLNQKERDDLLRIVHSSGLKGMQQFNSDRAKSFQVEVNGGTAYTGDININNNIIDAKSLEKLIKKMIAKESKSRGFPAKDLDFFAHTANKLERAISNYHRYRYLLSNLGCARFLVIVPVLVGTGIFFSGILSKTAVVKAPYTKGAYAKDDSANIIETISNGTIVRLTGERDTIGYCKTSRGWIYCDYLVENGTEKEITSNQPISGTSIVSPKNAIVQPDSQHDGAKVRAQPNSGKVIGIVAKGAQVQVLQCRADACEVTNNSIRGWIYKPYLRQ